MSGARSTGQTLIRLSQEGIPANGSGNFTVIIAKPAAGVKAQVISQAGEDSSSISLALTGGEWSNVADLITRIDVVVNGGGSNFAAGSSFLLEGLNA